MIINFMAEKLIISFNEYTKIVEKLAIQIHNNYKPTVLVGIMSCLLYTSPSPRDVEESRMPSSA